MNKVILTGRLVREPEMRYTQGANPTAIANFTLAVNRRFKREGEPDADFINCVAIGKNGEFVEKYFKKGQMVSVVGRLQVRSWENNEGKKQWTTEVMVEENYFAESKQSGNAETAQTPKTKSETKASNDGFIAIEESVEDIDLPF